MFFDVLMLYLLWCSPLTLAHIQVVQACCLEADFKILEHGDATVIGERIVEMLR